jgi:3-hydroxymyristoyl/3-hydroxydecanoyl-(acyl carrier protein) dehydratase
VLGPRCAAADTFPTRVRLPDEPLMLVDRIMTLEGEPASMSHGRVITEHDVHPHAWYLDCGRIPTCIAVEAGQADLFLCAYLGIDLHTRGLARYRLLDAEVTFYDPLPPAGATIQYDIHIDHFFRQGNTWLFHFHFDGRVAGKPLISMRNGCAGFFTQDELEAGQGIVQTSLERLLQQGVRPQDWHPPVALQRETYDDTQIAALRNGRLAQCFGPGFTGLPLQDPVGLPSGRMNLVHRVLDLDPAGGRYGIGRITGEADIHPDDWFLTCHFVDDQVMPGTLMYECCLHTLRIYLLRMGWVGEAGTFVYEPIPGINSKLKCRGQVSAATGRVQYEITLKEYGYQEDGTPYVRADALMYADGRAIVQMTDMSLRLSGLTRQRIEDVWRGRRNASTPLFDRAAILAFAVGDPSAAFGDRYRIFDRKRVIARLPGPPFQFLDRIVSIRDCRQWELTGGGVIEAHYDVPADAWYFRENRQPYMPFSVLLEVALQPCGWLAAYLGSALTSAVDLSFRNLGGEATQYRMVTPDTGTLVTTVQITNVSRSGGMIIQHFAFQVCGDAGLVYRGTTYFGFFTKPALANQIGIREARMYRPLPGELSGTHHHPYPDHAPYPAAMMRMIDAIDRFDPAGGPHGLGFITGSARVDPGAWFFQAHFYQDPVWPGSLGLESLIQLLKVAALQHWGEAVEPADLRYESMGMGQRHAWLYRGQILPTDNAVNVQAVINHLNHDDKILGADGFLSVDGRIIYQMTGFTLKLTR